MLVRTVYNNSEAASPWHCFTVRSDPTNAPGLDRNDSLLLILAALVSLFSLNMFSCSFVIDFFLLEFIYSERQLY